MRNVDGSGGASRPLEIGLIILALGLSMILLCGLFMLAGKIRDVEKRAGSPTRETGVLDKLSARIDSLSDRVEVGKAGRPGSAGLEGRLSDLADEIAALKQSDEGRTPSSAVDDLKKIVLSLEKEVEAAKRLAEEAVEASPEAPEGSALVKVKIAALSDRLDDIETQVDDVSAELTELAKKPSARAKAPARINEKAVQKMVDGMVDKAIKEKLDDAMRNMWRGRNRGGRGQ